MRSAARDQAPRHHGCFPAGTPIDTPTGPRPIEDIRAGDEITAVGPDRRASARKVAGLFASRNALVEVRTDSGTVVTTAVQPLELDSGSAKPAGEPSAGDRLLRHHDGKHRVAVIIAVIATGRVEKVFNLILEPRVSFVGGGFVARSNPPAEVPP